MWLGHMIHKIQAIHFTKAKIAIITMCLVTNFTYGGIALVLLALVHSTEPGSLTARVLSQATWPYTHKACEAGSDKLPLRGI